MGLITDLAGHRWHHDMSAFVKMKILAIDDEQANLDLLEDMLGEAGYTRIKSITDSRIALEICASFEPDLVLLDLMMPHIDGFAILESLRATRAETYLPVIVLTADANRETKWRALGAGATDFLVKPLDQLEVLLRMANCLETRRLHVLLDTQRAAYEEALRIRSLHLRDIQSGA